VSFYVRLLGWLNVVDDKSMVVGAFVYVYFMLLNLVSKVGVSLIELLECKSYLIYAFVELLLLSSKLGSVS